MTKLNSNLKNKYGMTNCTMYMHDYFLQVKNINHRHNEAPKVQMPRWNNHMSHTQQQTAALYLSVQQSQWNAV